ncbi:MAG TPA: AAA family ATPase [Clostridiales bacterium]|nr:AAA family ATPase [Clostridiales bacterium]
MKEFILKGESKIVEYKREYSKTILKTVCAFANYIDGYIVVGIDDFKHIVGVEDIEFVKLQIESGINDTIVPKPYYEMESEMVGAKTVIILKVYKGASTPYTMNNKAYKRMDTSTVEVDRIGYEDLILRGRNQGYDEQSYEGKELKFNKFSDRLKNALNIGHISEDIYKTLGLMKNNKYDIAAALVSDENPIKNSKLVLIRFEENMNIKDRIFLQGVSIVEQFEKSIEFYNKHINTHEIIEGAYRKTIEEVPLVAFRETVANAIVHRDYSRESDIKIEIFDDRIEVISPGGLPIGITEEEYIEGKISIPRNKVISDIFLRLKIIERLATGVRRIKEYYKDSSEKPIFCVSENAIKVILPKSYNASLGTRNKKNIKEASKEENKILDYIKKNRYLTRNDAQILLELKKTQTTKVLKNLINGGVISKIGEGKATKYIKSEK